MNTKHITIRPATIHDAPIIASALTMALGEEAMKMYCGENYQSVLEELAQMENTQYSYHNALIADVDGIPVGAIIGYDGARLHELREPTLRLIQERTGQTFSQVQDETNPHEYYLDSLGVLPEYRNLDELKDHYRRGGLGDVKIKRFLNNVIQETLTPIRERRHYYEQHIDYVYDILEEGSKVARQKAAEVLKRVRRAIGVEYFEDMELRHSIYTNIDDSVEGGKK